MWPGLVVRSKDGLREPAQAIRHWQQWRARSVGEARFVAFGYDMDNMKARAWNEGEMPLWQLDDETRAWLDEFIRRVTASALTASRLTTRAVKSALYERLSDATGNFGFIAERFFRDTEGEFFAALREAVTEIEKDRDSDDPMIGARERWAPVMSKAALRLFDEYAPSDGLENRDMRRHVEARFHLVLALGGRGKAGKSLFDGDLGIPSPETARARQGKQEAA